MRGRRRHQSGGMMKRGGDQPVEQLPRGSGFEQPLKRQVV